MSNIQALRKKKGLTQSELAQKLSVKRSALSMWELGRSNPSIKMLPRLAVILDCTIDDLIGGMPDT